MGGGFGGKESQACAWAALAALAALRHRPAVQGPARPRRRFRAHRQAPRFPRRLARRLRRRTAASRAYDVVLNARCGCSADLSPGVVDRAMFHAANCYWLPDVAHRLAPAEDQHRLQHRLPRLRRPAGHDRDRARDGRDRARARPRSARRAQGQFLPRRRATRRPTAMHGRGSRDAAGDHRGAGGLQRLSRAPRARSRAFNADEPDPQARASR